MVVGFIPSVLYLVKCLKCKRRLDPLASVIPLVHLVCQNPTVLSAALPYTVRTAEVPKLRSYLNSETTVEGPSLLVSTPMNPLSLVWELTSIQKARLSLCTVPLPLTAAGHLGALGRSYKISELMPSFTPLLWE